MTSERVSVAVFKAANNWPLYAAIRSGALVEAGVKAEVLHVSSSKRQMRGLVDGEYDIVHTAADNVVAVHVEPDSGVPAERRPKIFMGGDGGFLSVHASKEVGGFADLRGRRVGFDSTTSGFAFVLKKILLVEGLKPGDYHEVVVGGTDLRYKALLESDIDAAIMTPPHDLLCSAAGLTRLAEASHYLPKYQGLVGACLPGMFPTGFLVRYKAALGRGLEWLRDRGNKDVAVEVLRENLQMAAEDSGLLSSLYDSLPFRERSGFDLDGNLDPQCLQRVASLRREFSRAAGSRSLAELLIPL